AKGKRSGMAPPRGGAARSSVVSVRLRKRAKGRLTAAPWWPLGKVSVDAAGSMSSSRPSATAPNAVSMLQGAPAWSSAAAAWLHSKGTAGHFHWSAGSIRTGNGGRSSRSDMHLSSRRSGAKTGRNGALEPYSAWQSDAVNKVAIRPDTPFLSPVDAVVSRQSQALLHDRIHLRARHG